MKIFGYDIKIRQEDKRKGKTSLLVDYYRGKGEQLVFSQSEILDCQNIIVDRLSNVEILSEVDYLCVSEITSFIKKNLLQILRRLFYDGYFVVNTRTFKFADLTGRIVSRTMGEKIDIPLYENEVAYTSKTFEGTGYSDFHFLKDKIKYLDTINSSDFNLIENYGAMGIVSPETDSSYTGAEFTASDIEEMQANYSKHYGIKFGKWSLMFVPRPTKYNKIDLPISQLQLSEKRKYALQAIYAAFGIPKELSVYFENSTYENRRQAELDFYNSTLTKWAKVLVELAKRIYEKIQEDNPEVNYLQNEFWFRFVDVMVLQEAKSKQIATSQDEVIFWEDIKSRYPQYAETAEKNIQHIIENL